MRSLGARLQRQVGGAVGRGADSPAAVPTPSAPASADLASDLARYARLRTHAALARGEVPDEPIPLEAALGGGPVASAHGDAWVIDTRFPGSAVHGSRRLDRWFARDLDLLPRLTGDPRLEGRRPEETLFLDIEATGLEQGAGTHAFLVGLGHFEDGDLLVRQLLLLDPSDERALLDLLVERLESFPLLASFNGKSYDLTVLQTRLVLHRLYSARESSLKLRPHFDLLHLSRNLYRGVFPDTRLGTLEKEALGFRREDDLPGHLCPACWFHWLRTGDAGPLAGVVLHNLHDVVSMVTLADRLVADAHAGPDPTRDPRVSANLGRLLLRRGDPAAAHSVLLPLVDGAEVRSAGDDPGAETAAALRLAAVAARRSGDFEAERRALDLLLRFAPDDAGALTARARFAERRERDLEAARRLLARAGDLEPSLAATRRLARIEGRLSRGRHLESPP